MVTTIGNVNIDYADRIAAFLIIDRKVYTSDCDHQECLEMYYTEKGIKSEFDYSNPNTYDDVHEEATHKTYAMKESHEAYGFDLFDTSIGYVLAGHDKTTIDNNIDWAKGYAKENEAALGYFVTNHDIRLIEEV